VSIYFQHVGLIGGNRDFPRTIGTPEQGLVRFQLEQITPFLVHLSSGEMADIRRVVAEQAQDGFQIWGIPAGAKAVLRDMRNGVCCCCLKPLASMEHSTT